jgi:hypothetical protein
MVASSGEPVNDEQPTDERTRRVQAEATRYLDMGMAVVQYPNGTKNPGAGGKKEWQLHRLTRQQVSYLTGKRNLGPRY